jgi:hypothetical protein
MEPATAMGSLAMVKLDRSQQVRFRFGQVAAKKTRLPLAIVGPAPRDFATARRAPFEGAIGKVARTFEISARQRHRQLAQNHPLREVASQAFAKRASTRVCVRGFRRAVATACDHHLADGQLQLHFPRGIFIAGREKAQGGDGATEMLFGLQERGASGGILAGALPKLAGLARLAGLGKVIRHEFGLRFRISSIAFLEQGCDRAMKFTPPAFEKQFVSSIAYQCVLEAIKSFWRSASHINEVGVGKGLEALLQFLVG